MLCWILVTKMAELLIADFKAATNAATRISLWISCLCGVVQTTEHILKYPYVVKMLGALELNTHSKVSILLQSKLFSGYAEMCSVVVQQDISFFGTAPTEDPIHSTP